MAIVQKVAKKGKASQTLQLSGQSTETDIWPSPIGTIDVVENSDFNDFNFEFNFVLPVVRLMGAGIEEFSFCIKPSQNQSTYQYFTGNIKNMEEDISNFFTAQAAISGQYAEEYSSYYYDRISLTHFLSDENISKMGALKSGALISEHAGRRSAEITAQQLAKRVMNVGNYLKLGSIFEPPLDLTAFPEITSYTEFKRFYRDTCGIYSLSAADIGDVQYPRSLTNKAFDGEAGSTITGRIPLGDPKWPQCFWDLWGHLFSWTPTDRNRLPTVKEFESDQFPCSAKGTISFPNTREGRRLLSAFLLRDTLTIEIKFFGSKSADHLETITKTFSALKLLKDSSNSMEKVKVNVTKEETQDKVSIYNPNYYPVACQITGCGWDDQTSKLIVGGAGHSTPGLMVPPRSEQSISISDYIRMSSRFYEISQWHGSWVGIAQQTIDGPSGMLLPTEQIPWLTVSTRVPGVYGVVNPALSDPAIGVYRSTNSSLRVNVSNIPPYIDEIKYYLASVTSTGAGAQRAPGSNRSRAQLIAVDPGISSVKTIPSGVANVDYAQLFPGNYEIIADLYRKGCLLDSVSVIFSREPTVAAAKHGVEFGLNISEPQTPGDPPIITIKEEQTASSADLVALLKDTASGAEPYMDPFNETWADSNYISLYELSRFNMENSTTEELGLYAAGDVIQSTYSDITTKNHVYIARQFVATAGQLICTQSPTYTTNKDEGARGGLNIVVDYAKFSSQESINSQKLPKVKYQLADTATTLGWPSMAMGLAKTGFIAAQSRTVTFNVSPTISKMSVVYDEQRVKNVLSWRINWPAGDLDPQFTPKYFLLTAKYGGVTSLIAKQLVWTDGMSTMSVIEPTLAGALGKVTYYLHMIYPDGSIENNVATCKILHTSDVKSRQLLGRGH